MLQISRAGGVGGEARVTYAARGFGQASKSDTRGDGGLFLEQYYRFTLSSAAVGISQRGVGEDGEEASHVGEREGDVRLIET